MSNLNNPSMWHGAAPTNIGKSGKNGGVTMVLYNDYFVEMYCSALACFTLVLYDDTPPLLFVNFI